MQCHTEQAGKYDPAMEWEISGQFADYRPQPIGNGRHPDSQALFKGFQKKHKGIIDGS
jgi:hypothetical protein